ncbi:MAG TPA: gliding motility protein GldL [Bacteroidia bacterium]|nr:gliding motility protein GldL [Bacteroidia bacterium]HNT80458.1 gliding motility protein GldL [Bacteroidia bacterium]
MGLTELTQGKGFKNLLAKLYGWGAAIVILGALFKIQHWPGAGLMLTLGLSTEAIIFFFSAFEPPHEEYDWSLVYPELAGMHEPGYDKNKKKKQIDPVSQKLDLLMSEANIGPELLESLGTGLRSLSDNASKMNNITDASIATEDYVKSVKTASKSITDLNGSYSKAVEAMDGLSNSTSDVKVYTEQVQSAGKNLAALNAVYELQLQDSNNHLKESAKFYEGINELMNNLHSSLEDTRKYREEVSKLAGNLSSLNTVYGNMLSAMNVNPSK